MFTSGGLGLGLVSTGLGLVLLFWSWSCKQRSWSCSFGLGLDLKNLVLFTSLLYDAVLSTEWQSVRISFVLLCL